MSKYIILLKNQDGKVFHSFIADKDKAEKFFGLNLYSFNNFSITALKITKNDNGTIYLTSRRKEK